MLRFCQLRFGAARALKPVLGGVVERSKTINRFIGLSSSYMSDGVALNAITGKAGEAETVGVAARLSRACMHLRLNKPGSAIQDVNEALKSTQDESLRQMGVAIRLRARNDLLDLKETALDVAGMVSQSEVHALRSLIGEDYKQLRMLAPKCWLVELAAAEYDMYIGNHEQALHSFTGVEKKIQHYLHVNAAVVDVDESTALTEGGDRVSQLAFRIERALQSRFLNTQKSPLVGELIDWMANDTALIQDVSEFKKTLHTSYSLEEAMEIILILRDVQVHHHFHNFFPIASDYADWGSDKATRALQVIRGATDLLHSSAKPPLSVDAVRGAIPSQPFVASQEALMQCVNSAPSNESVLSAIRARFGASPQTPLSVVDEIYFNTMREIKTYDTSCESAGTLEYVKHQQDILNVMARQMLYRVQTQLSVALLELDKLHESVEKASAVIETDEYIHMWRSLLVRSRALKGLGLITASDRDLKMLRQLKSSLTERAPYEQS